MAADPLLRIPCLYHFTCKRNLPSIGEMEGLFSTALLRLMGVEFFPGGNDWSLDADAMAGMDHYVHLCFALAHPMEKHARDDGRIESPFYLQIDRLILYEAGVRFSAGVSNKSGMSIMSVEEARDQKLIDYDVLYTFMPWVDPVIQDRRQAAERCEILVPDHLPMKFIKNFPDG